MKTDHRRALLVRVTQPATENMWHAVHLLAPLAVELRQGHFDFLVLDCLTSSLAGGPGDAARTVERPCNPSAPLMQAFLPVLLEQARPAGRTRRRTELVWLRTPAEAAASSSASSSSSNAESDAFSPSWPSTQCYAAGSQWGVEHVTLFGRDKGSWRGIKSAFVNQVNAAWRSGGSGPFSEEIMDEERLRDQANQLDRDVVAPLSTARPPGGIRTTAPAASEDGSTTRSTLQEQVIAGASGGEEEEATSPFPCSLNHLVGGVVMTVKMRGGVLSTTSGTTTTARDASRSTARTSFKNTGGGAAPSRVLRVVFALRFGDSRRVENLAAVLKAVCLRFSYNSGTTSTSRRDEETRDPPSWSSADGRAEEDAVSASPTIEFFAVDLSLFSIRMQHRIVQNSLLIGPHGQALSWLPFSKGVIELMPFMAQLATELCRKGWNNTPMYAYGGMGLVFDVPHLCLLGNPRTEKEKEASLGTELNHWIRRDVLVDAAKLADGMEEFFAMMTSRPPELLENSLLLVESLFTSLVDPGARGGGRDADDNDLPVDEDINITHQDERTRTSSTTTPTSARNETFASVVKIESKNNYGVRIRPAQRQRAPGGDPR
ncbi:unnamed protein product [Amoebophrya sp. A120]|nr:unnamed protein product [Amoebophrya sp. A120]|eukprot:GSA120T00001002001.1